MSGEKIIKFLKLLRDVGCIDPYWKSRIDQLITDMGGQV